MIECENLRDGKCVIASVHAESDVFAKPDACKACISCTNPRSLNSVTASLAMRAIGFPLPENKKYLLDAVQVRKGGPGTELKKLISWFWWPAKKCGRCGNRALKMDKWGTEKCKQRKDLIVAWLRQSAEKHGLPFSEKLASILVSKAIRNAERPK